MPPNPLVVPTILVTGSLHFAEVQEDSTANDVIRALISAGTIKDEVLGDLDEAGWALQRIRSEPAGRSWEEAELEALGDGAFPSFVSDYQRF